MRVTFRVSTGGTRRRVETQQRREMKPTPSPSLRRPLRVTVFRNLLIAGVISARIICHGRKSQDSRRRLLPAVRSRGHFVMNFCSEIDKGMSFLFDKGGRRCRIA
jgi:hypothetical protein